jgi:hypothetical protein
MSVAARNDAAMSFIAWAREFETTVDMHEDDPRRWRIFAPKFVCADYTEFVNGAAILRDLYRRGKISYWSRLIGDASHYAKNQLKRAIETEDWDAARAWLRPGIAYHYKTYDKCASEHPVELGQTAREGRADGLRQELWCILVREAIPKLSLPPEQLYMQGYVACHVLRDLEMLNRRYPLDQVALEDDRFGDGTVLEVWLKDLSPHLTHLRNEFALYERELRFRSPLPFDTRLALAEGLHARLGASSNVGRLTSELAQMIVNSDATHIPRGPVHLLPPEREISL